MEGGVTATTDLPTWTVEIHLPSSPSSGLVSDQTTGSAAVSGGRRRWYQPVHPLLSLSAPGRAASAASSWMSTLPEETMTVRAMLTKEKPYSTEILQAVHTIVLHCADTRVIVLPIVWLITSTSLTATALLYIYCATSGLKVKALTELANIID